MSLLIPKVEVFFDLAESGGDFFTLDDPVKGLLSPSGGTDYVLAGDIATDVTSTVYSMSISRGRTSELEDISTGVATVRLRNYDARFLPGTLMDVTLTDGDGVPLTDDDGNPLTTVARPYSDSNLVPGKRVRISVPVDGESIVVFDGPVEDWEYGYNSDRSVDASFTCVDALGQLARKDFDAWTTTAQFPGARIAAVLDRDEVGYTANRDIDVGSYSLQADNVSWGSNVVNYLRLVSRSDAGRLFASRDGVLTFRDRNSIITSTVSASFADTGAGIRFTGIGVEHGSEFLYNRVSVDREGGTAQTSSDATSQTSYGVRSLSIGGLLLDADTQSSTLADWYLGIYKNPTPRVSSVTVVLDGLTVEQQGLVARLDLGSLVSVSWAPTGTAEPGSVPVPVVSTVIVDGVSHSKTVNGVWSVVLALTPMIGETPFVLDDVLLGVLDSSVLGF